MRQLFGELGTLLKSALKRIAEWGKKYDLTLTLIGSVIVFGSYLNKDFYVDDYKSQIAEMEQLRNRYKDRKLLVHISQELESLNSQSNILERRSVPTDLFLPEQPNRPHMSVHDQQVIARDLALDQQLNELQHISWSIGYKDGCSMKEENNITTRLWQIRNAVRDDMPYDPGSLDSIQEQIKGCESSTLGAVYDEERIAKDYLLLNNVGGFFLFVFGWALTIVGKLSKSESSEESWEDG